MKLISAILLLAVSIASVTAQTGCSTLYDRCKQDVTDFKTSTCDPFNKNNQTVFYADCLCYAAHSAQICYGSCDATNATVIADTQTASSLTKTACTFAGLNADALPNPAPWQTFFATSVPVQTATQNGAQPTNPGGKSTSNGFGVALSMMSVCVSVTAALLF